MLLTDRGVLTAVARLVADAPTPGDAMSRLARVVGEAIPFERLHVLRLDRADSVVVYVARAQHSSRIEKYGLAETESS